MDEQIENSAFLQQCLTHPGELGRFIGDHLPPQEFAEFLFSLAESNIVKIKPGLRDELVDMAFRVFSQVRCVDQETG